MIITLLREVDTEGEDAVSPLRRPTIFLAWSTTGAKRRWWASPSPRQNSPARHYLAGYGFGISPSPALTSRATDDSALSTTR